MPTDVSFSLLMICEQEWSSYFCRSCCFWWWSVSHCFSCIFFVIFFCFRPYCPTNESISTNICVEDTLQSLWLGPSQLFISWQNWGEGSFTMVHQWHWSCSWKCEIFQVWSNWSPSSAQTNPSSIKSSLSFSVLWNLDWDCNNSSPRISRSRLRRKRSTVCLFRNSFSNCPLP